eukprot:scaffold1136_cov260-Pinguiococcus_pyrenoidosus.AAC.18
MALKFATTPALGAFTSPFLFQAWGARFKQLRAPARSLAAEPWPASPPPNPFKYTEPKRSGLRRRAKLQVCAERKGHEMFNCGEAAYFGSG